MRPVGAIASSFFTALGVLALPSLAFADESSVRLPSPPTTERMPGSNSAMPRTIAGAVRYTPPPRSPSHSSGSLAGSACAVHSTGWVRNVGYDTVEAVVEGEPTSVERLIDVMREGPSASHVDEAKVEWEEPTGEFERFGVRRST